MTKTVQPKEFGFYPDPLQIKAGPITISPLPDLKRNVSDVRVSSCIENNWFYAPPQQVRDFPSGEERERPYTTRVFGLPKTHRIEHTAATNEEHLDFHLWALSFFVGMRLTAAERAYLDATPVQPGKLVDFVLCSSLDRAVELAEAFWKRACDNDKLLCAKRFAAAVHALFLSQNPQSLRFEKFVLLYMAIDACFRLAVKLHGLPEHTPHPKRIELMCKQFGMQCPGWADRIAGIRNNTFHEALFMDAPLGFAGHGSDDNLNLPLEMRALVCRLLVALIGFSGINYVRSPVNTRQRHGLDL